MFSAPGCPKCELVKFVLEQNKIDYSIENAASPAGLAELRMRGYDPRSLPIIDVILTPEDLDSDDPIGINTTRLKQVCGIDRNDSH